MTRASRAAAPEIVRPAMAEPGLLPETVPDRAMKLARELAAMIGELPLDEAIATLNRARTVLHEASPFQAEPVDLVLWVRGETVDRNEYNPNRVAPPEMKLLQHSIEADGFTQPMVTARLPDESEEESADPIGRSETVDGFHRGRCGKEVPAIRERLHGYLPITRIRAARSGEPDRIGATIRHNRARGVHRIDAMSDIVRRLYLAGWKDEKIQTELGMQADEVLRLKQVTGLAVLFADRDFSEAWEADR